MTEGKLKGLENGRPLLLEQHPFHLHFLHCNLTGVQSRYQLCEKIKTDERTSHIPVILLTARSAQEDKLTGLETGADAYLIKPFNAAELKLRIAKLIEQRRQLQQKFSKKVILRPAEMAATSADERFLNKALEILEENIGNETFGVQDFSTACVFLPKLYILHSSFYIYFLRFARLAKPNFSNFTTPQ